MASGVRLDIGGDDRAKAMIEALNRKIDDMEGKLKSVAKQSAVTEREGKKLWEQTRTPLEKYNVALERAKQLLDQGKISQETYARSVERAKQAMDATGSSSVQWLTSLITKLGAAAIAAKAVTGAFQEMAAARQQGMGEVTGAAPGLAQLAQLAGGSQARYRQLVAEADKVYAAGAAPDRNAAAQLSFALRSAGAGSELPFFTQLGRSQAFGDVASLARATAALRTAMPGAAGSFQQTVSQALGASGYNPQGVQELLTASARGGGFAEALGVGPSELLAATAVSATASGGSERGATRIAGLLREVEKTGGYKGLGMVGIVQKLQGLPNIRSAIRDSEAIMGFRDLAGNLPTLQSAITAAETAKSKNLAVTTARMVEQNPEVAAAIRLRQATAREELDTGFIGIRGVNAAAAAAEFRSRTRAAGGTELDLARTAWNQRRYDEWGIDVSNFQPGFMGSFGNWWEVGKQLLGKIAENTDSMKKTGAVAVPEY